MSVEDRNANTAALQARAVETGMLISCCASCGMVTSQTPSAVPGVSHGVHLTVPCLMEWGMGREAAEQMIARHAQRRAA